MLDFMFTPLTLHGQFYQLFNKPCFQILNKYNKIILK